MRGSLSLGHNFVNSLTFLFTKKPNCLLLFCKHWYMESESMHFSNQARRFQKIQRIKLTKSFSSLPVNIFFTVICQWASENSSITLIFCKLSCQFYTKCHKPFKKPTYICYRILYMTLFSLISLTREGSDWLRDCAIHKPIRVLTCNP